ncbi:hypothetical protein AN913_01670 [Mycobacteroides immunogenum]|nr:hypothetical protein AN913_01670 [Mycobacteroides immunogenum]KPG37617.1 hypothetical protein AN912_01105 [Mycobacteroides immunogenum]KPG61667.1 hypothetical protein AN918_06260 [Mycobacteroides immunogenum]
MLDIDDLWGNRDKMMEQAEKVWDKLVEASEGIAAPFTYLGHASDWDPELAGIITPIVTTGTGADTNLSVDWQGLGADSYAIAREDQKTALANIKSVSKLIAAELNSMADRGWKLYTDLFNKITDFMAKFYDEIGKFGNPFRLIDAIPSAVTIITNGALALRDILESYVEFFRGEYKSRQNFKSLEKTVEGFEKVGQPAQWPVSAKDRYKDGSVKGGHNDWSVKPGVITNS